MPIKHSSILIHKPHLGRHLMLVCLCLTLWSCGGGNDDVIEPKPTPLPVDPDNGNSDGENKKDPDLPTLSIDARPTDWIRIGTDNQYVPGVSLSLVIAAPVITGYATPSLAEDTAGDLMAIFVGGTCRGVSALFTADQVFMPTAVSIEGIDNPDADKPATIKYYSAQFHHIFTAKETYQLKNAVEIYGTRSEPVSLSWEK